MPRIWRLIKTRHAPQAFDGEGARLYGARWNSPGTRVAYASGSIALAMLEVLVHLKASQYLTSYSVVAADVPDEIVQRFPIARLPANWKQAPPPAETQAIGDAWVTGGTSAALSVPSAIVESESNYLLNPLHRDFSRIRIDAPVPFAWNARLGR